MPRPVDSAWDSTRTAGRIVSYPRWFSTEIKADLWFTWRCGCVMNPNGLYTKRCATHKEKAA